MDDDRGSHLPRTVRTVLVAGLAASLAVVAALTLVPTGRGWSWGAPVTELRWYVTGLGSGTTIVQLVGNLGLLVLPAALAVALWPALGRLPHLTAAALATGAAIELLQWALPLGRVVSPLDAVLNAVGAVVTGSLVGLVHRSRSPAPSAVVPAAAHHGVAQQTAKIYR